MSDPNHKYPDKNSPPPEGCPQDGVGPAQRKGVGPSSEKNPILTHIDSTPIYRNFTPYLPANVQLRSRARSLRKAGNYAEVIFWMQVHKNKFFNIDFDRQRVIGNYIVDFYIKGLSLVIEIDGSSHNNKQAYDKKREEFLRSLGLNIFRISDTRIKQDLANVLKDLKQFILETYGGKEAL